MIDLPDSTIETLNRMRDIESQVQPKRFHWKQLFRLKRDNLVLFGMIGLLGVLAVGMSWMVRERQSHEQKLAERKEMVASYKNQKTQEVSLGEKEFVSSSQINSGQAEMVSYEAVLTVEGSEHDYGLIRSRIDQHRNKINEKIEMQVSSAPEEDFKDPALSKLRNDLRLGVNEILGEGEVLEINFSKFVRYELKTTY
ncbi:MAG TPA: hypothetical protein DD473_18430 [Planctomycetaceae bacterium]|nr:hypothetical protein [Planctomycetaceae bacterium]